MNTIEKGIVEEDVRLSSSKLWRLQQAFYTQSGMKCWQECVVPNFVTSNCYIAAAYARAVLALARDVMGTSAPCAVSQPMYIIELGAGAGKLSFVLMHKLLALRRYWPRRADGGPVFKYVITDVTDTTFPFFRSHACLKPLLDSGLMDLARYDAEEGGPLTLEVSGEVLQPGSLEHPVVCVANYVFDSLRQDAFRVSPGGALDELRVTVAAGAAPTELIRAAAAGAAPELLRYVKCSWRTRSVPSAEAYYPDDPDAAAALEALRKACEQRHASRRADAGAGDASGRPAAGAAAAAGLPAGAKGGAGTGSSFLLPVGALAALRALRALSARGALVALAGDKGHTQLAEMDGARDPHVAIHGSFSCMVNFVALRLHVEGAGGLALSSPSMEGFKCVAYALGLDGGAAAAPSFRQTFAQLLGGRFGPDGFSTLQRCLKEESKAPGLRSALAIVRLSQHDPDVFYKFKQAFIDKAPHASDKLQNDIRHDLHQVYACYFPLLPSKDVAFELGRIYMGLKDFAQAVDLFTDSQRHCGVHHVSWYNMGVCHYYLNQLDAAARCFDESLSLCPDYPDALKWRRKVEHLKEFLGDSAPATATAADTTPAGAAADTAAATAGVGGPDGDVEHKGDAPVDADRAEAAAAAAAAQAALQAQAAAAEAAAEEAAAAEASAAEAAAAEAAAADAAAAEAAAAEAAAAEAAAAEAAAAEAAAAEAAATEAAAAEAAAAEAAAVQQQEQERAAAAAAAAAAATAAAAVAADAGEPAAPPPAATDAGDDAPAGGGASDVATAADEPLQPPPVVQSNGIGGAEDVAAAPAAAAAQSPRQAAATSPKSPSPSRKQRKKEKQRSPPRADADGSVEL